MEVFIFARFHARDGEADTVAAALRDVVGPTAAEPGCVAIGAFHSSSDPRLFYIHSRWVDAAAFERHGGMPHTTQFLRCVEPLLDDPLDVTRAQPLR